MQFGKTGKIIIGLLTLWPILYIFVAMVVFILLMFLQPSGSGGDGPPYFFFVLMALHLFTMFFMLALVAFYIYYLFKTDRVPEEKKALWAAVIFLGNMIAMPVFWYLYIWKEPLEQ